MKLTPYSRHKLCLKGVGINVKMKKCIVNFVNVCYVVDYQINKYVILSTCGILVVLVTPNPWQFCESGKKIVSFKNKEDFFCSIHIVFDNTLFDFVYHIAITTRKYFCKHARRYIIGSVRFSVYVGEIRDKLFVQYS